MISRPAETSARPCAATDSGPPDLTTRPAPPAPPAERPCTRRRTGACAPGPLADRTSRQHILDLDGRHRDAIDLIHEKIAVTPAFVQEAVEVALAAYVWRAARHHRRRVKA